MIFFLGRAIQSQYGEKNAIKALAAGILGGGAVFIILNAILGREGLPVVGASAGAMAIICVACLMHYERQLELLLFFVLPVRLKAKWILWGLVGFDAFMLLSQEIPGKGGPISMAHSAHLGGALAGYLFYKYALIGDSSNPIARFFKGFQGKSKQANVEVVKSTKEDASLSSLRNKP